MRAVNDKGEELFLVNGQWVPEPPIPGQQAISQEFGAELAPGRTGGVAGDILLSTAEGVSLGTLDEMAGAIGSLLSEGVPYEEAVQRVRQRMSEIPTATRVTGNIVGGALTGPAAGLRAPTTVAQAARQGAGLGTLAGAGFAEGGLPERAAGAAIGAGTGGVLGAAGQAGMSALSRAIARVRGGISRQVAKAYDDILGELQRNEKTLAQATREVQELGPEGMFADLPELQALAGDTATKTGAGRTVAGASLRGRADLGQTRLDEALDLAFQDRPLRQVRKDIMESMRNQARDLYEPALDAVDSLQRTPALDTLIGRPITKTVKGKPVTKVKGGSSDVMGEIAKLKKSRPEFRNLPDTSPRLLHEVRMSLADKSKGQGARKRTINAINQQLTDAMDEAGAKGYRKAVDTYRSDNLTLEAFDKGRDALKELPEVVEAYLTSDISAAEREAFIAGLGRQVARDLATGETGTASQGARSVLKGEKTDVLKQVLGPEAFEEFRKRLQREITFTRTGTATMGGAPTQPRQATAKEQAQRVGRLARAAQTARTGGGFGTAVEMLTPSPAPNIQRETARARALFQTQAPGQSFAQTTPLEELAARELNLQGATLAPLPQLLPGAAGVGGGRSSSALLEMLGF